MEAITEASTSTYFKGGITEAYTSNDVNEGITKDSMDLNEAINKACTNLNSKLGTHPNEGLQPTIYRVHKHLRDIKCTAYEPEVISIGPYHRGKVHLKMMEDHKLHTLQLLLAKIRCIDMEYIVRAVGGVASEARKCYADQDFGLNDIEFIEMLVLDGCFIIELVQIFRERYWRKETHPIFHMGWMLNSLQRDLMLFENQIPFFVLLMLFDLIYHSHVRIDFDLVTNLSHFFSNLIPGSLCSSEVAQGSQEIMHILDLIHRNWLTCESKKSEEGKLDTHMKGKKDHWSRVRVYRDVVFKFLHNERKKEEDFRFMNCATRLTEANVKFKVKEAATCLFDIEFKDGTMVMPPLDIEDKTECLLRNLIAYEQYFKKPPHDVVTQYMILLDNLINSSKDMEILSENGIISNWQGDDEVVAKMVNRLGDSIALDDFKYAELYKDVKKHCRKRKNRWMAKLRRDYLHSPWAIISILAAVVLLVLTVMQTVLSLLQVV